MTKNKNYQTLIFDCDGVILNSNKIKTEAFYEVGKQYGHYYAHRLMHYHIKNGGISRYAKFEYFLTEIMGKKIEKSELDMLLQQFAKMVKKRLMNCEIAQGLNELKVQTSNTKWLVVSGSDQKELREIFAARGIDKYFDGGIFGSPDTKDRILEREKNNQNIITPALFLGDSEYDYKAADKAEVDFLFISRWTEVDNYLEFCEANKLDRCFDLSRLNNVMLNSD